MPMSFGRTAKLLAWGCRRRDLLQVCSTRSLTAREHRQHSRCCPARRPTSLLERRRSTCSTPTWRIPRGTGSSFSAAGKCGVWIVHRIQRPLLRANQTGRLRTRQVEAVIMIQRAHCLQTTSWSTHTGYLALCRSLMRIQGASVVYCARRSRGTSPWSGVWWIVCARQGAHRSANFKTGLIRLTRSRSDSAPRLQTNQHFLVSVLDLTNRSQATTRSAWQLRQKRMRYVRM